MKILMILLLSATLAGCGLLPERRSTVDVMTTDVTPEIFHPSMPAPLQLEDVRWFVVTRENVEEQMAEVERFTGQDFVVFGVVPKGYENMSWNFQEVRRYIRQLQAIVLYYREVTRAPSKTTFEDWMRFNRERQESSDPPSE